MEESIARRTDKSASNDSAKQMAHCRPLGLLREVKLPQPRQRDSTTFISV